jgi:hypothetical protein
MSGSRLDRPVGRRSGRALGLWIAAGAALLLVVLFLRRGSEPQLPLAKPPAAPEGPREPAAPNPGPTSAPVQAPSRQGKGTLEVRFDLAMNINVWVVVTREGVVETRKWARIVADPRTDPKNYTPKEIKIPGLLPGAKKVLIVANKFLERKLEASIREEETTILEVRLERDPNGDRVSLDGTVVDSRGKPIQGARVTLETEDPELSGSIGDKPFELWHEDGGVSSSLHLHGQGDDASPYSQEYLDSILSPSTRQFGGNSFGATAFSDGTVRLYWITADDGWFHFSVRARKQHVVSAEYRGIEKKEPISPGEKPTIVLNVEATEQPSFQDNYARAMKAMVLKDVQAKEEVRKALEARSEDPKAEARAKKLIASFDEAAGSLIDFNFRDLGQRDAFIKKAKQVAFQVASVLTQEK